VTTDKSSKAEVNVVLGEMDAPQPAVVAGAAGSPIKELKVVYPRPAQEPVFWSHAFERVAGFTHVSAWLLLYVIAYIPVLAATRFVLKVA
jgi:hypothetical protein